MMAVLLEGAPAKPAKRAAHPVDHRSEANGVANGECPNLVIRVILFVPGHQRPMDAHSIARCNDFNVQT